MKRLDKLSKRSMHCSIGKEFEKDYLKASRKAAREEEISRYGKPCMFRPKIKASKKKYDRNREKAKGIESNFYSFFLL